MARRFTTTANLDVLQVILDRARRLDAKMERLFLDAGIITGDVQENGFTYDAVFNGGLTARELVRSIAAGHYVREAGHAE